MPRFAQALQAWGSPGFSDALKQEIERLDPNELPLQEGLAISSHVADSGFSAMILDVSDDAGFIRARTGIFYFGIIAGCSCADDPTPVSEQTEHCVVLFSINKRTAETTVKLLEE